MLTVDQLFEGDDHWGRLHDCAVEVDGKSRTKEEIRALWDLLPETIQNEAHCWGMETVFGDMAYVYFRDNPNLLTKDETDV